METSSVALGEKFYGSFQNQKKSIAEALDSDRDAFISNQTPVSVEKHFQDIAELQRQVQDALHFSNSHDTRIYSSSISELKSKAEALRDLAKPKSKFSFRSARRAAPKIEEFTALTPKPALAASTSGNNASRLPESLLGDSKEAMRRKNVVVSERRIKEITTASVRDVVQSVVDLASQQGQQLFAGLHVVDISESIIFCGATGGGLHITNVKDSVLVARTHQFRMHQCSNVVIYLAAGSSPIIENCTDVKFAPFSPDEAQRSVAPRNAWNEVMDFQYPGLTGPSPNWSEISETTRADVETTSTEGAKIQGKSVRSLTSIHDLRTLLESMGVKPSWPAHSTQDGDKLEGLLL